MRLASHDPAEANRRRLARMERVADVVLLEFSCAPAGYVEPAVVDRQIDVGDQRGRRTKGLKQRWQVVGVGGLGRDGDHLIDRPLITVLVPQPHRRRQVLGADYCVDESPRFGRVVGRAQLEDHLVLVTKVDALGQLPLGHAPEVHMVSELASEQVLGIQPILDHRRCRPLRCDHGVVLQMPPDVVRQELRSPVQLPRFDDLERVVVDQRDAAGTFGAVDATQRRHEDAAGSAVHRVRARVSGLGCKLTGLDRVRHHRLARVGLGVEDIGVRRANARDEQVATLERLPVIAGVVAAMPVVAQRARACAPAEMVQLVARRRQLGPADHAAVRRGVRVAVHHGERILRWPAGSKATT